MTFVSFVNGGYQPNIYSLEVALMALIILTSVCLPQAGTMSWTNATVGKTKQKHDFHSEGTLRTGQVKSFLV